MSSISQRLNTVNAASQPGLWLEGLLLISQHIQKALAHSNRADSTQPLGFVCSLRHTQLASMFTKLLSKHSAPLSLVCGLRVRNKVFIRHWGTAVEHNHSLVSVLVVTWTHTELPASPQSFRAFSTASQALIVHDLRHAFSTAFENMPFIMCTVSPAVGCMWQPVLT